MHHRVKTAIRRTLSFSGRINTRNNLVHDNGVLQLEKGNLEAVIREKDEILASRRTFLAYQYLRGRGIEIGAAHHPIKLPPKAIVQYVDIFSAEDLRRIYPEEYREAPIVDVIDDGEKLSKFKPDSLDFIVANHFLEHCLDPIGTIITMCKKLRRGGVLYLAIPDKRYTFDSRRTITGYAHLLAEHADTSKQKFREAHTKEYVETVEQPEDPPARVRELLESGYRIHYHVWTQVEMTELFVRLAKDFDIDLEIEALLKNHHEVVYILRKQPRHKPIDYHPNL